MNRLYGIGLGDAYKSQQRWHDINAYGGRRAAWWSWPIVLTGVIGLVCLAASDCDCRYSRDRANPGRTDNALDKCN